jgi:hypothetical protein
MFSMTDGTPERVPGAAGLAAVEDEWPRVETDLAAVDARVRTLVARDRVDELATRRARRARRRALHAARYAVAFRGGDAA